MSMHRDAQMIGSVGAMQDQDSIGRRSLLRTIALTIAAAGVFEPNAVTQLFSKCEARVSAGPFSNADNMALVGVISTQLLHQQFIAQRPDERLPAKLTTDVDRVRELCR